MDKSPHSAHPRPASAGLIRLQAQLVDLTTWVCPTWAALCGVVASGGFTWRGEGWSRLALLILLVDGGWGTLWAALGSTNWAAALHQWRTWEFGERTPKPPYTLRDSPGDRVISWIGLFRAWWRHLFWLDCGPAVLSIIIALLVTALLGVLLGQEMLLLSMAAAAAIQAGAIASRGSGAAAPEWNALLGITFPWLAGHVAFGPLTLGSSALALLLGLAWGTAWRVESPRGRILAGGAQLLAAALLAALEQPLAAGCLALLSVPQLALLPWIERGQPAGWYVRYTRSWLMAAMLIAAWAL
ncbi:MAG: hypothetical protein JW918_18775 [Anaerolineae bacterium]|nr:hypothetical protein [Anaerolineae bacterium]